MNALISFVATYLHYLSIVMLLYCGYTLPNRKAFVRTVLLTGVLALALGLLTGSLYSNPRPFIVSGVLPLINNPPMYNGFPSGHALFTGTIAAIVSVFNPYFGAALWLVALAVSVARVLAGVHHSIDIVASFLIAMASAAAVQHLHRRYTKPGK
jgi:membrane-associated phospholipid phosphatase